ncbi:hypothetical protein [[Clostridium] symbiosum]|uniref:Uncharacterized protein n=1 Tax=[Clostridium] symbiosum ATCC 14940 TaxID=411472 RepID=A0ABC9U1K8_CLOSY|nr:hypothetical protein [[Clostridium] symbiosum]ERI79425.1 hypothetical protein CLOSYM_00854 [[Clostridium] symbiosum ATCC 14940]MBS6220117.1 hypothetical protein [[Clostridium] symbiosum]MDM8135531.1 hypothetical protein [[Clostridium] symbiosum]MDM8138930.1 hypothetical protein [[Clostridium] symbiosum]MDM8319842.1 hypothetical protein [[Clostridium] symbiosum]
MISAGFVKAFELSLKTFAEAAKPVVKATADLSLEAGQAVVKDYVRTLKHSVDRNNEAR